MMRDDILSIRRRALNEAAQIAWDMAEQNRVSALKLRLKANKQMKLYDSDVADQNIISAQVLDACAEEARCIYARILALAPASPADFVEGGGDVGHRNLQRAAGDRE